MKKKTISPVKDLIACGPWLAYNWPRKILLTMRFWLPWVLYAAWRSKYLWWRYLLYKLFNKKPMVWADIIKGKPDKEDLRAILSPSFTFYLVLSGRGRFLWYENRKQLEKNKNKIDYPVDWSNRGVGWYPFW